MYNEITPEQVEARLNNKEKFHLIDVRELEEWEEGHIAEAAHLPLSEIQERLDELPKDENIIFVCRSGGRSGKVCGFLAPQGYSVTNMTGGMLAWPGAIVTGA
ncbi:rhodanese-like domain-containing protein [Paenibacillus algorifonticola]|uniref:rhodanese-like domain-containing protein n=1 Tax=Paenibacillus algorifonticola TaxID=684063 RepID=UPI003D28BABE